MSLYLIVGALLLALLIKLSIKVPEKVVVLLPDVPYWNVLDVGCIVYSKRVKSAVPTKAPYEDLCVSLSIYSDSGTYRRAYLDFGISPELKEGSLVLACSDGYSVEMPIKLGDPSRADVSLTLGYPLWLIDNLYQGRSVTLHFILADTQYVSWTFEGAGFRESYDIMQSKFKKHVS